MYERVLFPTDASEGAAAATEHALEVARRFDAPLHVLNVVDVSAFDGADAYSTPVDPPVDAMAAAGEDLVESVRERAEREGIDATTAVTDGSPAAAIVEATAPGDIVVMGTHGRTGLDRYLVGSTTEKVVRSADVPVLTVPLTDGEPADEPASGS